MNDAHYGIAVPSAQVLEERWQQSLAQFELWTEIWRDNPELARQAGKRVQELMLPLADIHLRYEHMLT
jgi:hypothetical protein